MNGNPAIDQYQPDSRLSAANSPFLMANESEYQRWRAFKLSLRNELDPVAVTRVDVNTGFSTGLCRELKRRIQAFNFILYEFDAAPGQDSRQLFIQLNQDLGLFNIDANPGAQADGITELHVVAEDDQRSQYIPYTNRALNWHTDGYYNPSDRQIGAFALHCVRQAGKGGSNFLFDHELMYIRIRDTAPDLIEVLMANDLMVIPANVQSNRVIRSKQSGPVFTAVAETGELRMRYSARPRNIGWKSDKSSLRAVNLIREILMDDEAVLTLKLESGQGIICNNLLHGRKAFADSAGDRARLYYRARYKDRISFND